MLSSESYKGHDVILQALPSVLKRVPNLIYVIVGEGDDRSRIQALAQKLGLGSHVMFTGSVSDSELVAIYRRSDVFALPARTVLTSNEAKGEGFGIVFLEAMAFGKPVIGPNFGAPAEFIRNGENGLLVDPDSVTSIAGALVELLTNPEKGRELGKAGREGVRKSYSYGSFCERLVGLLPS
jgi:phosphatidylinositol alpha-1,6-mannosyltransferase